MLTSGLNMPIDILEFNTISYCPGTVINDGIGVTIMRVTEFEFIFGILKIIPSINDLSLDNQPFMTQTPGFKWTCPTNQQVNQHQQKILIRDVLSWWQQCDEKIGLINLNFEQLSADELLLHFPREKIKFPQLSKKFISAETLIKAIPIQNPVFFKDLYHSHWILNRQNQSKLYLVNVVYLPDKSLLELKSDAYIIDELAISLFDKWNDTAWEELSLSNVLELKNHLLILHADERIPAHLKFSFKIYSPEAIKEWGNPMKYNIL